MNKSYRGKRVAGGSVLPVIILLIILAAAGVLVLQGCNANEELPGGNQANQTDQTQQQDQTQQDTQSPEEKPEKMTSASGVSATLTELGEDAIRTGELILVNNWNYYDFPAEEDLVCIYENKSDSYIVARTDTEVAPVALEALNTMLDAFRAQGGSKTVNVVAGYRTEEFQQHLFDQSAERNGLEHAQKYVAQPGGSEHHTGYAVDFSILNSDGSSADYDGTGEYAWINENCHNYGYVVRYETGKEELTGIWDEPWHFRYLGVPHATKLAELGLCMEEYIDYLKDYTFEGQHLIIQCEAGEYEVWYTQGSEVYLPDSGEYAVSGNNVDGIIVTYKVS